MSGLSTYVINLDRSPHRMAEIGSRLGELGLDFVRIAAIDGRTLGPPPWPDFDEVGYRRCCGKTPNPREYACYVSHLKALSAFLDSGDDFGLILEDDADLAHDAGALLKVLMAQQEHWDTVQLGWYHWGGPVAVRALTDTYRLAVPVARHPGAFAYLVNRRAAETYVRRLLPMSVPYDLAFDEEWRLGLRFRTVLPQAAKPTLRFDSTIAPLSNDDPDGRKFSWWRRRSVLAYRVGSEATRLAWGCRQVVLSAAQTPLGRLG